MSEAEPTTLHGEIAGQLQQFAGMSKEELVESILQQQQTLDGACLIGPMPDAAIFSFSFAACICQVHSAIEPLLLVLPFAACTRTLCFSHCINWPSLHLHPLTLCFADLARRTSDVSTENLKIKDENDTLKTYIRNLVDKVNSGHSK